MKLKAKKVTTPMLSDKIADALTVKPRPDIEDDDIFNTKPHTLSRAEYSSDSEDEETISDFRKQNVNLLSDISKKYEGTVVSRQELAYSSHDSSEDLSEEEGKRKKTLKVHSIALKNEKLLSKSREDISKNESESEEVQSGNHEVFSSDDDGSDKSDDYSIMKKQTPLENTSDDSINKSDSEDEEGEGNDISQLEEPVMEEFEHIKKQNLCEEAKKGSSVRNQLLIWESLLEMRIHLQRCLNTANCMPMADKFSKLKSNNVFEEESKITMNNVANILDKFLTLQNVLLKNYPETKNLSNKKLTTSVSKAKEESDEEVPSDTDNEEIPSDTDAEDEMKEKIKPQENNVNKNIINKNVKKRKLDEYESDISVMHKTLKGFRDTTIQKWNEKTRLATATNNKSAPANTILQQISYILSDREKLIRRTQLKRSDYDIVGYENPLPLEKNTQDVTEVNPIVHDRKDNDEYLTEIFDDSDFYHQLLRELIECKSADISDPVQLSRQWIALQHMRSKMKRKVDTRATKGRKIKYVVHNKLVSYMAPEKSLKWNDESTNELYSSLFGKMFEQNNVGVNIDLENVRIK